MAVLLPKGCGGAGVLLPRSSPMFAVVTPAGCEPCACTLQFGLDAAVECGGTETAVAPLGRTANGLVTVAPGGEVEGLWRLHTTVNQVPQMVSATAAGARLVNWLGGQQPFAIGSCWRTLGPQGDCDPPDVPFVLQLGGAQGFYFVDQTCSLTLATRFINELDGTGQPSSWAGQSAVTACLEYQRAADVFPQVTTAEPGRVFFGSDVQTFGVRQFACDGAGHVTQDITTAPVGAPVAYPAVSLIALRKFPLCKVLVPAIGGFGRRLAWDYVVTGGEREELGFGYVRTLSGAFSTSGNVVVQAGGTGYSTLLSTYSGTASIALGVGVPSEWWIYGRAWCTHVFPLASIVNTFSVSITNIRVV